MNKNLFLFRFLFLLFHIDGKDSSRAFIATTWLFFYYNYHKSKLI